MSKQDWQKQICAEDQSFCIQIWLNFPDVFKIGTTGSTWTSYENKMLRTHWWNVIIYDYASSYRDILDEAVLLVL